MKRLTLFLTCSFALGLATPIMPSNDRVKEAFNVLVDELDKWNPLTVKRDIKETAKEVSTNFAMKIMCAGAGLASIAFAGLGIKKLFDHWSVPPTVSEAEKKQEEAKQQHQRRIGKAYLGLGLVGCLASLLTIKRLP